MSSPNETAQDATAPPPPAKRASWTVLAGVGAGIFLVTVSGGLLLTGPVAAPPRAEVQTDLPPVAPGQPLPFGRVVGQQAVRSILADMSRWEPAGRDDCRLGRSGRIEVTICGDERRTALFSITGPREQQKQIVAAAAKVLDPEDRDLEHAMLNQAVKRALSKPSRSEFKAGRNCAVATGTKASMTIRAPCV